MPIMRDIELTFLHIPKCAGTSIMKTFNYYKKGPNRAEQIHSFKEHRTLQQLHDKGYIEETLKWPVLALVRHPAERLISAFKYLRRGRIDRFDDIYGNITWREFLESEPWVNAKDPKWFWPSQSDFFKINGGMRGEWYKLENIANDWSHIAKTYFKQPKKKLAVKNASGRRMHYSHYFDHDHASKLQDFYWEDFENFSYDYIVADNRSMWTWLESPLANVINMTKDTEKLAAVKEELKQVGLDCKVIKAHESDVGGKFGGRVGCTVSHRTAIEQSADRKKPILVVEDDCKFIGDKIQLAFAIDECLEDTFDTLWLGNHFRDHKLSNHEIKRTGSNKWTGTGCLATHALVYSPRAQNAFVKEVSMTDPELNEKHVKGFRMDWWLGSQTECTGVYPMAFIQKHHKSTTCKTSNNYEVMGVGYAAMVARHFGVYDEILDDLTIVVKAFNRPNALRASLTSIRKYYPTIKIIVVDDGYRTHMLGEDEIIDFGITYLNAVGFDIGIGKGRNIGLDHVETSMSFISDDDHIFYCKSDLAILANKFKSGSFDVLAGSTIKNMNRKAKLVTWYGIFEPVEHDGEIKHMAVMRGTRGREDGVILCDYVPNNMIVKTDSPVKFYEKIKTREHLFYFRDAFDLHQKVGYTEEFSIWNSGSVLEEDKTPDYNKYRIRKSDAEEFGKNFVFKR